MSDIRMPGVKDITKLRASRCYKAFEISDLGTLFSLCNSMSFIAPPIFTKIIQDTIQNYFSVPLLVCVSGRKKMSALQISVHSSTFLSFPCRWLGLWNVLGSGLEQACRVSPLWGCGSQCWGTLSISLLSGGHALQIPRLGHVQALQEWELS